PALRAHVVVVLEKRGYLRIPWRLSMARTIMRWMRRVRLGPLWRRMNMPDTRISRISKLLVDRDETALETALERRHQFIVTLRCGDDLAQSYTLQLAVLTAVNIAIRCFPGAVRIALGPKLAEAPLLLWPSLKRTFGQQLVSIIGPGGIIAECGEMPDNTVVCGNAA